MAFNILVVDDESDIRDLVSGILSDNGYDVETAGSYVDALEVIQKRRPSLVVLDVWLGDGDRDGIRLLEVIKKDCDFIPVIMMSGHGTIETAVFAIRRGAYDFIEKPFDSRRLITSIEKAIDACKLQTENAELKIKAKVSDSLVGQSHNVITIKQMIEKIAPLNGRCAIIGPFGSDKEIVARAIHRLSPRVKSPFLVLNCKSEAIIQLEVSLFGMIMRNEDDTSIRTGLLERVGDGTLFIDELVTTPLEFQQQVLRVLKDGTFSRIGSNSKIESKARILASFPPNILNIIKDGGFIDELYCRISANVINILPLKSRREDISYLLDYYMAQTAKANNVTPKRFSNEVLGLLNSYHWPGDVMQMKNMMDWILTVSLSEDEDTSVIMLGDLPQEIVDGKQASNQNAQFISVVSEMPIRDAREIFEREYFIEQLNKFNGNISQTAKFVGMERSALHRKLRSLNIIDSKSSKIEYED
ncbi:MAG: sigma-54 dependent transcriptional regulator [Holosporales bacterium]|jgi:two-component system nitrogen regulation response regulator NtrX|nr:sigma-54 dependent transcriptional regulator [Holosporales bacterium]